MAATTTLLGLLTPTQGTLSGTWGDSVNYGISDYLDIAIAGTLSFAGDGAITLANTTGSSAGNAFTSTTAQYMVIRVTGTQTVVKVITGPSYSKLYMVDHAGATSAVTFKAAGQTGVSVAVGEKCFVYYNGTDYVKVASSVVDGVSTIDFGSTGLTPNTATSGAVTVAGTLAVANGGTSLSTLTANNVIIGNGTSAPLFVAPSSSGNVLTSNGTTWTSSAPAAGGIVYTTVKTANYTAVANDGVLTNTTGGAFTVNLPATPATGTQVFIADSAGTWGTNNLTIGRNGSTIEGVAQDLVCDINSVNIQCVYNGTTWDIFAQIGANDTAVVTLNGTQTLTNKTMSGASNTFTNLSLTTAVTGTLPTANGGTNLGGATPFTANGVVFASSTSALATGSALSFDGSVFGLSVPAATVKVESTTGTNASYLYAKNTGGDFYFGRDNSTGTTFSTGSAYSAVLYSGGAYPMVFFTDATERMRLTSTVLSTASAISVGIGTSSPSAKLTVISTYVSDTTVQTRFSDNTGGRLEFGGNASAGKWINANDSGTATAVPLIFQNGSNVERMRLDTAGNVGIGTSSPAARLSVIAASANSTAATIGGIEYGGSKRGLTIKTFQSNGGDDCGVDFNAADGLAGYGGFKFSAHTTTLATLNYNGVLALSGASTTANGVGITFPATQSASSDANTLDDYEEGTFTVAVAFGGASVGITYDATPTCTYTKIGRQVTVTGRVGLTNKGSSTGDATITGLPFTPANTGNAGYGSPALAFGSGTTFANVFQGVIVPNSTAIVLQEVTEAGVNSSLTNADFSNGSNILFSVAYFI